MIFLKVYTESSLPYFCPPPQHTLLIPAHHVYKKRSIIILKPHSRFLFSWWVSSLLFLKDSHVKGGKACHSPFSLLYAQNDFMFRENSMCTCRWHTKEETFWGRDMASLMALPWSCKGLLQIFPHRWIQLHVWGLLIINLKFSVSWWADFSFKEEIHQDEGKKPTVQRCLICCCTLTLAS